MLARGATGHRLESSCSGPTACARTVADGEGTPLSGVDAYCAGSVALAVQHADRPSGGALNGPHDGIEPGTADGEWR